MKKLLLPFLIGIAMAAPQIAAADEPRCDFSDTQQPFLNLPFKVTNVEVTGEWTDMRHNYYLADSYDKVLKQIHKLFDSKGVLDKYVIMGITPQTGQEMTQIILAYHNEHFYVQISPNGAGTLFSLEARPISYVTGVYDVSIYGFVLPDGTEISTDTMTEE